MMNAAEIDRKNHRETIYRTKQLLEVSGFQPTPETSLGFYKQFNIPLDTAIIDIRGGDSLLVDHLLKLGYSDITVPDISEAALSRAQLRLGNLADKVTWNVADAAQFKPTRTYDFWHDRGAFRFLTNDAEIARYLDTFQENLTPNGIFVLGTFSKSGPKNATDSN